MNATWRARNALTSASLGWMCAWVIALLYIIVGRFTSKYPDTISRGDELSLLAIYLICTAVITLIVSVVFIVPYACLRSSHSILLRPWRMYLEPCLIGIVCISLYDVKEGASADSVYDKLTSPFLYFAILTSLFASFFFLRRLRTKLSLEEDSLSGPL